MGQTTVQLDSARAVAAGGKPGLARRQSARRHVGRLLRLYPLAIFGGVVVSVVTLTALLAPVLAPHDPNFQELDSMLTGPTLAHPFGFDELGRDIFSRVIFGTSVSLQVGIIAVSIAAAIGVPLGLIAGYYGGWWDEICMRLIDAILAFPPLVLALAISGALGPSLNNLMIAVGIVYTPSFARVVRGQVLAIRLLEYMEAARAIGASDRRIILRHSLPNILAPVIVLASLQVANAVLAEAALSFLGLGVRPPTPSWGFMISVGRNYLEQAPWLVIAPGGAILLTVLAFNFLGDAARDALDPRMSGRV